MPHIIIESGSLNLDQKRKLITGITDQAATIMNIPKEFFTVTLHELPDSSYGIGGRSIDLIKEEYQKSH